MKNSKRKIKQRERRTWRWIMSIVVLLSRFLTFWSVRTHTEVRRKSAAMAEKNGIPYKSLSSGHSRFYGDHIRLCVGKGPEEFRPLIRLKARSCLTFYCTVDGTKGNVLQSGSYNWARNVETIPLIRSTFWYLHWFSSVQCFPNFFFDPFQTITGVVVGTLHLPAATFKPFS